MTVSATGNRAPYTGNAVTTAFAFPYPYTATSDLKVYVDGALQVSGYSVSAAGPSGTVTFSAAPASGAAVVILRDVPKTQGINLTANDAFPAETNEAGFDRATLITQDLAAALGRTVRVADYLPAIAPIADPDAVVLAWATAFILATAYGVTADGVTDDTAAMIVAINAAVSEGKELWLPEGTIVIDQITLPASMTIRGQGRTKTIFKRKANSANPYLLFASAISDLVMEGFSVDGNYLNQTASGFGIRFLNCVRPAFKDVGAYGWRGLIAGNPAGAGLTLEGGSGALIDARCYFNNNYDGAVTIGHTDGRDLGATYTANLARGLLIASASHGWRTEGVRASGNSTTYAGAGILVINSDDCVSFGPECNSNTLGHGYQHNTAARCEVHGVEANSNGISGVDWFASPDGHLTGGVTKNNTVRGIEIDSVSPRCRVHGLTASGNTDVDISLFRSADAELISCDGNIKLWDSGGGGLTTDTTIIGGGVGYTLTVVSGEAARVRVFAYQGTISDTGGHIVVMSGVKSYGVPFANLALQNSWVADTQAIYYKDSDGIVHIEGRVKDGTVAGNTLIATLPAGFRPSSTQFFLTPKSGATAAFYIGTDGTIRDLGGSMSATWTSLNVMCFRAA